MILRRHWMDNGSVNTRQETPEPSTVSQSRCDWLYAGMLPHFHTATDSLNITFDDWSSVAKFRTLIKKTDLSDFFVFSVTLSTVYICCIIVIIVCRRLRVLYALASFGILTVLS